MIELKNIILDIAVDAEMITAGASERVNKFIHEHKDLKDLSEDINKVIKDANKLYEEIRDEKKRDRTILYERKKLDVPNLLTIVEQLGHLKRSLKNFRLDLGSVKLLLEGDATPDVKKHVEDALNTLNQFKIAR